MAEAKKKVVRKNAKRYEMVKFTNENFEGEFVLPKFAPPLGVMRRVQEGNVAKLIDWLEETGVDAEYIDAIDSIDVENELEQFIKDWTEGQLANAPKSSD